MPASLSGSLRLKLTEIVYELFTFHTIKELPRIKSLKLTDQGSAQKPQYILCYPRIRHHTSLGQTVGEIQDELFCGLNNLM